MMMVSGTRELQERNRQNIANAVDNIQKRKSTGSSDGSNF